MWVREDVYIDSKGRYFKVLLPDYEPDASKGMIIGPPLLDELGIDEDLMIRLHNELYRRQVFTFEDAKRRMDEIGWAISSVMKATAERVVEIYHGGS